MKVAILAAGDNRKYFPLFFNKPKCLYHQNGVVQIERVINDVKTIVSEKDIIIVGGYKFNELEKYIKEKHPLITIRNNEKYLESAIYSFRKAVENIEDDFVFMFGDESISQKNIQRIANSNKKLAILYHDDYYYYSLGIMKLDRAIIKMLFDDNYLDFEYIKKIYKFANGKDFEGGFLVNSGICIGYIMIDIIAKVAGVKKIEYPGNYTGTDVDFFHYNPKKEYIPDLDSIQRTDEYKKNIFLKLYNICISSPIKRLLYILKIWKR